MTAQGGGGGGGGGGGVPGAVGGGGEEEEEDVNLQHPYSAVASPLVVRTKDISMFEIFRGNIQVNSRGR